MTQGTITSCAHAKVNLALEVLGRRPDGYHEIVSLMQVLALCDTLAFTPARQLVLRSNVGKLEVEGNLVLRAARLLQDELGVADGAIIDLEKRIPIAAGLGGGSSDCAATLRALNRLWNLGLPRERLIEFGARLGSDVPFFFDGSTALLEGRGEQVTPLPPFPLHWVVLVTPRVDIPDKTRSLYGKITTAAYSSGETTLNLADRLRRGGTVDTSSFSNVFLPILLRENTLVRSCWEWMRRAGAKDVLLSGSGPTLFTLVKGEDDARSICAPLMDLDARITLTTTTSLVAES